MRYDFSKDEDWVRLIEFVFKVNIACVCLVYPFWRFHTVGTPGTMNAGNMTEGLVLLAVSCLVSGLPLLLTMIFQLAWKENRRARVDLMFAMLAITGGVLMMPPAMR